MPDLTSPDETAHFLGRSVSCLWHQCDYHIQISRYLLNTGGDAGRSLVVSMAPFFLQRSRGSGVLLSRDVGDDAVGLELGDRALGEPGLRENGRRVFAVARCEGVVVRCVFDIHGERW